MSAIDLKFFVESSESVSIIFLVALMLADFSRLHLSGLNLLEKMLKDVCVLYVVSCVFSYIRFGTHRDAKNTNSV